MKEKMVRCRLCNTCSILTIFSNFLKVNSDFFETFLEILEQCGMCATLWIFTTRENVKPPAASGRTTSFIPR